MGCKSSRQQSVLSGPLTKTSKELDESHHKQYDLQNMLQSERDIARQKPDYDYHHKRVQKLLNRYGRVSVGDVRYM